ncbi:MULTISPECIES: response regulator transcription factor [Roseivirga]|jgi:DNA-binding NarL/FixJ family response regulator|uniref:LuxR family transcriptional regulator n=1 Tax=Roseivirga spongicola TaxID=333140 RepID=A0A150XB36_9BACT|nr:MULTISPECIES: response regulator transcription factor [Roseivirga]PWL29066.1 MAG: DNA-binding response regulator [Roseivirga sp. XM-24bin3]KYG75935.1 LuxR family transcriptional regulator [Roseivirga spongicola]MBO6495577.1 response regulator transcription factor [Roseivirga sp.]MBO6659108.1 response regulator transcription factor [Roseivirga sp.]MBO6908155.1 response regulator transcription factor [Roseivirga sp.]
MIKIAIADDHKLFREGLRFLMDQMDDLEVVFEASNGKELLEQMENHEPDVLLLDLDMPEVDGLEALKQLRPKFPNLGIIILTMHSDSKMVAYLMELGANSYLLKDTSPEEFRKAISSVIQEGFYFNKMVSQAMLTGLKGQSKKKPTLNDTETLTTREIEVLELICQEYTAKEIAEKLFISHRTVEGHRKNLIEKLGVKNTAGLIVKAIKEGIIEV